MPKGQLSRTPWPGNSWMLVTFQPALRVPQQPHKHSHTLQLANHTQPAHHYIQYELFLFFKVQEDSSKYCVATSKHWNDTWKGH